MQMPKTATVAKANPEVAKTNILGDGGGIVLEGAKRARFLLGEGLTWATSARWCS